MEKELVAPITPAPSTKKGAGILDSVGAAAYSAANSALMGLPDLVVGAVGGEEATKKLADFKESNKEASAVGDLASFLIPGGAVLKGAKALAGGKLADRLFKPGRIMKSTAKPKEAIPESTSNITTNVRPKGASEGIRKGNMDKADVDNKYDELASALSKEFPVQPGGTYTGFGYSRYLNVDGYTVRISDHSTGTRRLASEIQVTADDTPEDIARVVREANAKNRRRNDEIRARMEAEEKRRREELEQIVLTGNSKARRDARYQLGKMDKNG